MYQVKHFTGTNVFPNVLVRAQGCSEAVWVTGRRGQTPSVVVSMPGIGCIVLCMYIQYSIQLLVNKPLDINFVEVTFSFANKMFRYMILKETRDVSLVSLPAVD